MSQKLSSPFAKFSVNNHIVAGMYQNLEISLLFYDYKNDLEVYHLSSISSSSEFGNIEYTQCGH